MNRLARMVLKNLFRFPGAYWKLCHYAKHPDRYSEEESYRHIQYIMQRAIAAGNVDLRVFGQENIPEKSGFLLYGNHQGIFDVIAVVASCNTPIGAVFKKELRNLPLLKQIITCSKSFALDRENVRQSIEMIQSVTEEIKKGRNYLIFPEGTRSKLGNQMLDFHSGSFKCALKTKCPVIPIAFIDSYKPLDQKGSNPVTVQIHYLPPIYYEEYQHMKTTELAVLVRQRIAATIENYTK